MRRAHLTPSVAELRTPEGGETAAPVGASGRGPVVRSLVHSTSRPANGRGDRRHKGAHERTISPVAKGTTFARAGLGAPKLHAAGNNGRGPARNNARNTVLLSSRPTNGRADCQPARDSVATRGKGANLSLSCQGLRASHLPASPASGWQGRKGFAAEPSVESSLQIVEPKMLHAFVPSRDSVARGDAHAAPVSTGVARGRTWGSWPSPGGGPAAERQSASPLLH